MLIVPMAVPVPTPLEAIAMIDDQRQKGDPADPTITVTARKPSPLDPIEKVNVKSYKTTQAVDGAVIAPIAHAYNDGLPKPVRNGFRNFLNNLHEPVVAINFLLQHRIGKAVETVGRFGLNSTLGVGGVIDVAKRKPFNLPLRANGFADSFAYYGVKPGPYLYLPLVGPTTPRDLTGVVLDRLVLPVAIGAPFTKPQVTLPLSAVSQIDLRARFDAQAKAIQDSPDPYVARRDLYFRMRNAEICALHRPGWTGCQDEAGDGDDKLTTQSSGKP